VRVVCLAFSVFFIMSPAIASQRHSATCMVLKVDRSRTTFVASCQAIPGYMDAMSMPLAVHDPKELDHLVPGNVVEFSLATEGSTSYAEKVKVQPYVSSQQDPWLARQLKLLRDLSNRDKSSSKVLAVGEVVPNFTLTDQAHQQISFSQFAGKVVALNFIYTSCALPNFCFRIANNFGVIKKRFKEQLGRDLVLLTVTFDPQRDTPEVLAQYAKTWNADPKTWHFMTGPIPEVRRVTSMFGMDFFPDEGLMNHSLHTAVIDRQGKLVANIEGNQFTAEQLSDLVRTVLDAQDAVHAAVP